MLYNGISFNLAWVAEHTQTEFVDQHVNAFSDCDHALAKMNKADREKWLKDAFAALQLMVKRGRGG